MLMNVNTFYRCMNFIPKTGLLFWFVDTKYFVAIFLFNLPYWCLNKCKGVIE